MNALLRNSRTVRQWRNSGERRTVDQKPSSSPLRGRVRSPHTAVRLQSDGSRWCLLFLEQASSSSPSLSATVLSARQRVVQFFPSHRANCGFSFLGS